MASRLSGNGRCRIGCAAPRPFRWILVAVTLIESANVARSEVAKTVVVSGLNFPCGVAVRPDLSQIFVVESGAGRVVRIDGQKPVACVDGLSVGPAPWLAGRVVGPLGISFLSRDHVAVGRAGLSDAAHGISVYELDPMGDLVRPVAPATGDGPSPAQVQEPGILLGPVELSLRGKAKRLEWRDYWGVATEGGCVYATAQYSSSSDVTQPFAGVAFARFRPGHAAPLAPFLLPETPHQRMRAITVSPEGDLVVGFVITEPTPTNRLAFYHARTGKRLANFSVPIDNLMALAFHPVSGLLYGLSTKTMDAQQRQEGMLHRLDSKIVDGAPAIVTVPIAELPSPTAMAFGVEGDTAALFVTLWGQGIGNDPTSSSDDSGKTVTPGNAASANAASANAESANAATEKSGALIKITGLD